MSASMLGLSSAARGPHTWCKVATLRSSGIRLIKGHERQFSQLPKRPEFLRTSVGRGVNGRANMSYSDKSKEEVHFSIKQGTAASNPIISLVVNLSVGTVVALIVAKVYQKYSVRVQRAATCEDIPADPNFGASLPLTMHQRCVLGEEMVKDGTIERIHALKTRPSDIFVASFPKSGTTWLQEVVYLLNHLNEPPTDELMETRFPYLEFPYPGLKDIENIPETQRRLLKTHLPSHLLPEDISETKAKVLYIYRNPKDVAVSYYHFAKMLTYIKYIGSFEQFLRMFTNDKTPYSPYFPHVNDYMALTKESPSQYLAVCYEDMKENPFKAIEVVAKFLGIEVSEVEIMKIAEKTSFEAMKSNPATNYKHWDTFGLRRTSAQTEFYRKGIVGDHENHLKNPYWKERMDEWIKTGTAETGLKFKYSIGEGGKEKETKKA